MVGGAGFVIHCVRSSVGEGRQFAVGAGFLRAVGEGHSLTALCGGGGCHLGGLGLAVVSERFTLLYRNAVQRCLGDGEGRAVADGVVSALLVREDHGGLAACVDVVVIRNRVLAGVNDSIAVLDGDSRFLFCAVVDTAGSYCNAWIFHDFRVDSDRNLQRSGSVVIIFCNGNGQKIATCICRLCIPCISKITLAIRSEVIFYRGGNFLPIGVGRSIAAHHFVGDTSGRLAHRHGHVAAGHCVAVAGGFTGKGVGACVEGFKCPRGFSASSDGLTCTIPFVGNHFGCRIRESCSSIEYDGLTIRYMCAICRNAQILNRCLCHCHVGQLTATRLRNPSTTIFIGVPLRQQAGKGSTAADGQRPDRLPVGIQLDAGLVNGENVNIFQQCYRVARDGGFEGFVEVSINAARIAMLHRGYETRGIAIVTGAVGDAGVGALYDPDIFHVIRRGIAHILAALDLLERIAVCQQGTGLLAIDVESCKRAALQRGCGAVFHGHTVYATRPVSQIKCIIGVYDDTFNVCVADDGQLIFRIVVTDIKRSIDGLSVAHIQCQRFAAFHIASLDFAAQHSERTAALRRIDGKIQAALIIVVQLTVSVICGCRAVRGNDHCRHRLPAGVAGIDAVGLRRAHVVGAGIAAEGALAVLPLVLLTDVVAVLATPIVSDAVRFTKHNFDVFDFVIGSQFLAVFGKLAAIFAAGILERIAFSQ